MRYDGRKVEQKWQKIWEEKALYNTDLNSEKEKFYCLVMFPYPSGDKLHIGHWYNFAPTDSFGRYMRMKGYTADSVMRSKEQVAEIAKYMSPAVVYEGSGRLEEVDLARFVALYPRLFAAQPATQDVAVQDAAPVAAPVPNLNFLLPRRPIYAKETLGCLGFVCLV